MKTSNKKSSSFTHNLGDAIERVGEKLSSMGASKFGRKVYEWGNKIEHRSDKVVGRPLKG